jgi:hypothetical protein
MSFASESRTGWSQLHTSMPPIVIALGFPFAIVSLRALDLFVLRLDSWPDPTIVSKTLGLLLVLGYLRSLQHHVGSVGLHTRMLRMQLVLVD